MYILRDNAEAPLQVACSVPDKHVVALAPDADGALLLATSPRGKVYRLQGGALTSVFEGRAALTSLTRDADGNLYVGTSPTCQVIRISPTGMQEVVMQGMGRGNRHVLAMQMVGKDLYVATGPAGGIYRIARPAGPHAEVTPIFAREDLRDGSDDADSIGPESVMVNALALTAQGDLLAAASSPGQVLKLEPRRQGAFLSTVLQTPLVARWGRLELQTEGDAGQDVIVESRSGHTAVPDVTWSAWAALTKNASELASPPATYAQFRVVMQGAERSPALTYARLFYQPANQAPTITLIAPQSGQYWSGVRDIRWKASDPDEDELTYEVYLSRDDGRTWVQMKRSADAQPAADSKAATAPTGRTANTASTATAAPKASTADDGLLRATNIPWDTRTAPDGAYRVRVVASDKYAKPTEAQSAEAISGAITVDNTAPTISLPDRVSNWAAVAQCLVQDNASPIVGGKYRINNGAWTALVAADGMFNQRQELVRLLTPNGEVTLPAGECKLQIQVLDAAGNLLDKTITITNGQQLSVAPVTYLPGDNGSVAHSDERALLEILLTGLQHD